MIFTYYGIIVFHNVEWIKYIKKLVHACIFKEVRYNALKQRHDVRCKAAALIQIG